MDAPETRYVYVPSRGSLRVEGFPAVISSYCVEDTSSYRETGEHVIVPGRYARDLVDWARELAPASTQFVDCGAHAGSWSLVMAAHFREVHAFEPQRLVFQHLCGNVALNGLTNVHAYHAGLDEAPGRLSLQRSGVDRGSSTARAEVPRLLEMEQSVLSAEMIDVVQLDSLVDVLTDVGLVKVDVEGLELRVLRGAREVLRRNDLPKLIVECWSHDWYREDKRALLGFLDELGYRAVPVRGYVDVLLAEKR